MTVNIQSLKNVINSYADMQPDNMSIQLMKHHLLEYLEHQFKKYDKDMSKEEIIKEIDRRR